MATFRLAIFGLLTLSTATNNTAADENVDPFRIVLVDGSVFFGSLGTKALQVQVGETKKSISVADVKNLIPGLVRRRTFFDRYQKLVEEFASDDFLTREAACKKMLELGPEIRGELSKWTDDKDLERRYRARRVVKELEQKPAQVLWSKHDVLELKAEKLSGRIAIENLTVKTKYGPLNVPLAEISYAKRAGSAIRVNLLEGLNLQKQALRGGWRMAQGNLVSPPHQAWALFQLNKKPPAAYTLRAKVKRLSGSDALVFPIIVGGRECNVCLDGWPRGATRHTGIELIRGQGPITNSTSYDKILLHHNKATDLQIDVTPGSVELHVKGKQIFRWKGNPADFSMQPGWNRPDRSTLAVGSYNASFEISELELKVNAPPMPTLRAQPRDLVIDLKDGSRFLSQPGPRQTFAIRVGLNLRQIRWSELKSLTPTAAGSGWTAVIQNGRTIAGQIASPSIEISTKLGPLNVPGSVVKSIVWRNSD